MTENPVIVLVNCISALFINRQLGKGNSKVIPLTQKVIKITRLPKDTMGDGGIGDMTNALIVSFDWLNTTSLDVPISAKDVRDRIMMSCMGDSMYNTIIVDAFDLGDADEDALRIKLRVQMSILQHYVNKDRLGKMFSSASKTINYSEEAVDIGDFIDEFSKELTEVAGESKTKRASEFGKIDPANLKMTMIEVIKKAKETTSAEGIMRTGLQGLNKGLGIGGFRRGELGNFGALTHCYKTGMLVDLWHWIPMFNTPYMFNEALKPLILRLSFENKTEQDLPAVHKKLWEQANQKKYDFTQQDPETVVEETISMVQRNGYHWAMEYHDPSNVDVWDVADIVNEYREAGYEIHCLIVDYPELICRKMMKGNAARKDEVVNSTFEILRNTCAPHNITCLAAHQLSTDAQRLTREGAGNFAKTVSTGGYYQYSQSLHTKLDVEWILHITTVGDKKYLMFARGKHRSGEDTPEAHKYFAYEFQEFGGICPDVELDTSQAIYGSVESAAMTNGTLIAGEDVAW